MSSTEGSARPRGGAGSDRERCDRCGAEPVVERDGSSTYCGPCALLEAREDSAIAYAVHTTLRAHLAEVLGFINASDVHELVGHVVADERAGLRRPLTIDGQNRRIAQLTAAYDSGPLGDDARQRLGRSRA